MSINKVLYNIDQRAETTETEKARARANIGAAGMDDIPSVPSPSNSNPQPPGTASPGNSNDYSRANHVHPPQNIPDASATDKGIVKLGSDTVQSDTAQSPSSTVGRTYAVQKDSNDKMVVNVPWTDTPPTTNNDKYKFLHYDSDGHFVWDYMYKGTYTINIKGRHTDSTSFREVVPEVLNSNQIEITETWDEVSGKQSEGKPGIAFNQDGTLHLVPRGNCGEIQKALNFFVSVGISNHDGYDITDEAVWGYDSSMVQIVGGMARGMPYKFDITDTILSHGINLTHAKTSTIYTEFRITLVADYLYTHTD